MRTEHGWAVVVVLVLSMAAALLVLPFWLAVGVCFALWVAWGVVRGRRLHRELQTQLIFASDSASSENHELADHFMRTIYKSLPDGAEAVLETALLISYPERHRLLKEGVVPPSFVVIADTLELLKAGRPEAAGLVAKWQEACAHEGVFDLDILVKDISTMHDEWFPAADGGA